MEGELIRFAGGVADGKEIRHSWTIFAGSANNRIAIPKWVEDNIEPEYYNRIPGTNVFQWEGEPAVEPDYIVESR